MGGQTIRLSIKLEGMKDQAKTKAQLIEELAQVRQLLSALQAATNRHKSSDDLSQSVLESMREAVCIINTCDFRIVGCNTAFSTEVGLRQDQAVGKICHEITHGRSAPCSSPDHTCPLQETLLTGKHSTAEHLHYDQDGNERYVEISTSPLVDDNGQTVQVLYVSQDVTARKRAHEALRQRERELNIRNQIDPIFLTMPDDEMYGEALQVILEATGSKYGVFGYIDEGGQLVCPSMTREIWDQCQIPDKDIVFPRETWGGIWGRALAEAKSFYSNGPMRVPEGHVPIRRAVAVPIIHQGEAIGILEVANKETDYDEQDQELLEGVAEYIAPVLRARLQRDREERERKRAEEVLQQYREDLEDLVLQRTAELRSTNELLERTFSTTHLLIAYLDTDFNFLRVNRAYAAADGRAPDFFVGKNHFDLYPHEENEFIFRRVVETGEPYTAYARPFEYEEHPERGVTYWDWTLHPVHDVLGKVEGLVLCLAEVTGRIKADEALRQSEENFRALADNANDAIIIANSKGVLEYANTRAGEIAGYDAADLLGMTVQDLAHPDEFALLAARLRRRVAGQAVPRQYETTIINRRGEAVPVETTGARTVWHGEPADIIIIRDITRRKQDEAALIQAEKLAVAGKLAASLAHEINNPLQSVIGCLGLAEETLAEGGDATRYLQIGREELRRAASIVAQLRDLSRKPKPEERELSDVTEILQQVLTLSRKQCQERGVEVDWKTETDLPELAVVPDRMQQVFLNLLLNAIDAMPAGGRLIVRAARTSEPDGVRLSFTDNGTGIDPEVLPHIFDPFYSTKAEGLGLGLFISRNIVVEHGGHIDARSSVGEGTTLTLWLPT
ncbi:MAG: PAS domain S-box protein [Anaerolineae bacterium]|nr:PAS domain S-box protein [Anaerolineae bacterium]NIN97743.1 PAS domain S-box protein [Anaerolineae bacterium]NIQ80733.1 PAS domain S-box protein [Anaerolineae bacterium]